MYAVCQTDKEGEKCLDIRGIFRWFYRDLRDRN
jgi:hypothetical protein